MVENQIKNVQIKTAIIQRYTYLKNNSKRIIALLIENLKSSIHIDRIMVKQKDKKNYILTDSIEIK